MTLTTPARGKLAPAKTVLGILLAITVSHGVNDTIQAMLPAIYPLLETSFNLDYGQVGLITLTYQMTGSILQPLVGLYTDRRPLPYSLVAGMTFSLLGVVLLSMAPNFASILGAAACVGLGSAVFHPEASRVARLASGGKYGFAQSLFQVGGNAGSSFGPLLAAAIVIPRGQSSVLWFAILAVAGLVILSVVCRWYGRGLVQQQRETAPIEAAPLRDRQEIRQALAILMALIFSKYFYLVSFTSFYTFYLIERFGVSKEGSLVYLFLFLFAVAAGTIIGGPVGDRIGRKRVIWASILGVAPFTLLLPHVGLAATATLTVIIGIILASAFSAMVVYAQELIPGKVGLISGLFFGFAFGMAGIGAYVLGKLADHTSMTFVFHVCAFLPLLGLLAGFLPKERRLAP